MKFVHEHENFRRKSLKGNGRGRIREVEGPLDILFGAPELIVMPLTVTSYL